MNSIQEPHLEKKGAHILIVCFIIVSFKTLQWEHSYCWWDYTFVQTFLGDSWYRIRSSENVL